tara:strand:+ start:144 stop:413 length:270 start_codon:yes stop_codon:yes gene_type:complete
MPRPIETNEREKGVLEHLSLKIVSLRQQASQTEQELKAYVGGIVSQRAEATDGILWTLAEDFSVTPVNQQESRASERIAARKAKRGKEE